jgi:hypothetical protein
MKEASALASHKIARATSSVASSPHRDRVLDTIHPSRLSAARMHVRVDMPWANAVNAYPILRDFFGEAGRECLNGAL